MRKRDGTSGSLFRVFKRDCRGATATEIGLIGLPFLALMLAILEQGLVFLASNNLDASIAQAARVISTGAAQNAGLTSADAFRTTYICPAAQSYILGSIVNCSRLIIDVRVASSFTQADISSDFYKTPTTNQFCPGGPNTITIVRVAYPMPSILPLLQLVGPAAGSLNTTGLVNDVPGDPGWKHLLLATAIFQTEDFSASGYVTPAGC